MGLRTAPQLPKPSFPTISKEQLAEQERANNAERQRIAEIDAAARRAAAAVGGPRSFEEGILQRLSALEERMAQIERTHPT